MHRHRVMNPGADPEAAQSGPQRIALGEADHILVKDVGRLRPARRQSHGQAGEPSVVPVGDGAAPSIILIERRELDPEDRRLDRVEARIDAA